MARAEPNSQPNIRLTTNQAHQTDLPNPCAHARRHLPPFGTLQLRSLTSCSRVFPPQRPDHEEEPPFFRCGCDRPALSESVVRFLDQSIRFACGVACFLVIPVPCGSELHLAWNASSDTTVAGYRVRYGTTSGSTAQTKDAGTGTGTTISGLSDGVTYYFTVVAYTSSNARANRQMRLFTRRPVEEVALLQVGVA